ncbi:aminotransferase class IV [Parvibaculum lavamentivorans DS-1]|uniref:Probable branched-chain-amino-acid aminotransferase n=1 Tax=Parvibaculum lavamentivorans (strain DS-1 / DSM 13023 / NCIMB 13966) TaxID=402881 RepID=A7HXU9_PARL1|nr:D-amino-acid transaminase [Parvibaculum lavamentivorans]ABS64732.1 aminotransferase class IV [Parvibaculum lavamentivorans DS-1]
MSRIAYVNGRYLRHAEASVHIEDRGYQFADGIYEVCGVRGGMLMDETLHLERMQRSLGELRIALPVKLPALRHILREVVARNRIKNGMVYFQITRGVAPRDHPFPSAATRPALVVTAKRLNEARVAIAVEKGVAVVTMPDLRWARRDIKSVALLPNILAKQAAREAGAYEAWLVDAEGYVTEGSSTNAWIVDAEGRLVTRPAGPDILNGVTRRVLLEAAKREGIEVIERAFTPEEAKTSREAFISASSAVLIPVVRIDGEPVGNAAPGSTTLRLRDAYRQIGELS